MRVFHHNESFLSCPHPHLSYERRREQKGSSHFDRLTTAVLCNFLLFYHRLIFNFVILFNFPSKDLIDQFPIVYDRDLCCGETFTNQFQSKRCTILLLSTFHSVFRIQSTPKIINSFQYCCKKSAHRKRL